MRVVAIVEGDGEVSALPVLLRRVASWRSPDVFVELPPPIRVRRDRFLNRDDEFRRFLLLAAAKCEDPGRILIVLDADDDCPAALGPAIAARAGAVVPHRHVSVILANREYEAWFIAAAASLHGFRGFRFDETRPVEAEVPRDAKGWVRDRMVHRSYSEATDQAAFSSLIDLEAAFANSRSFRKLCAEWDRVARAT